MAFSRSIVLTLVSLRLVVSDNCINSTECPVWPQEFSAPFGLYDTSPSIVNASSMFYYKYDENGTVQAQLVDYTEQCFPLVSVPNAMNAIPCQLLFIPDGIYLMQPALDIDCCLFVPDVGAVPPEFLKAYTYKNTNVSAPDMYGNEVSCDYWSGPDGFKYWTVDHHDELYSNWGHDIVFQDGPSGVTWRWGNFDVSPQDDSLFELPSGADCSAACSKTLSPEQHQALEYHVKLSRFGYGI